MRWRWYVASNRELMIDLDSRGDAKARLALALRRLKGAKEARKLPVESVWLWPSNTSGHYHLVVLLSRPISALWRLLWSVRLMDDPYRSLMNGARSMTRGMVGSLLIARLPWPGFYRRPDHVCRCPTKHDTATMARCPVATKLLRLDIGADYFGFPADESPRAEFGMVDL